ncbi:MAG: DUF2157 domain-containing protein [Knoellia sp.]
MKRQHMPQRFPPSGGPLLRQLDEWVERDLISREQAGRILADDLRRHRADTRPTESTSPVTEGLGYVGGVLVLIAAGLIAGQYFDDLGTRGRLGVVGVAAVALLGAGHLLHVRPDRPATGRLRSVLWALAVAAVAAFLAILASESFDWTGEDEALCTATGAALVAFVLWRRHQWFLQQVAVVASLTVALGSGVAAHLGGSTALAGLAIWGLGVVWLLLGWAGRVGPRHTTDLLGGLVVTLGAALTLNTDAGAALGAATAAGLVFTGMRLRGLVLLGVGSLATLIVVPAVVQRYFPDALAAPLALLVVGVALVVAALSTVSRRGPSSLS